MHFYSLSFCITVIRLVGTEEFATATNYWEKMYEDRFHEFGFRVVILSGV